MEQKNIKIHATYTRAYKYIDGVLNLPVAE